MSKKINKKATFANAAIASQQAIAINGLFSTHSEKLLRTREPLGLSGFEPPKVSEIARGPATVGMDDNVQPLPVKPEYYSGYVTISDAQIAWYASQGFIGYQLCAILAQHWLIDKACSMPARDAVRNGWDLSINNGKKLPAEMLAYVRKLDKKMNIKANLIDFARKGKIFGIRIALFKMRNVSDDYYTNPFNIDGLSPGQYEGIAQIDPYWITPELISQNLVDPTELHFYIPEFWKVSGKLIHRSHLIIYTTGTVPDVLKPSYYYGGVSVPQRIMERVYAAERSANEGPMLLTTKRLTTMFTDLAAALADEPAFTNRMNWFTQNRDNYGVKFAGLDDKIEQFETALSDVDAVIMTQYQLVAAIAEVPGTKLLGTQPKGFNSTGEFEESSYHESLESLQENDLIPLLCRHYELLAKCYVAPKFNLSDVPEFDIEWNELDAMTAQEQASVNATEAATDAAYVAMGAIEPADVTVRLNGNPKSGYNGLAIPPPEPPPTPGAPSGSNAQGGTRAAAAAIEPPLPKPKITPMKGA